MLRNGKDPSIMLTPPKPEVPLANRKDRVRTFERWPKCLFDHEETLLYPEAVSARSVPMNQLQYLHYSDEVSGEIFPSR